MRTPRSAQRRQLRPHALSCNQGHYFRTQNLLAFPSVVVHEYAVPPSLLIVAQSADYQRCRWCSWTTLFIAFQKDCSLKIELEVAESQKCSVQAVPSCCECLAACVSFGRFMEYSGLRNRMFWAGYGTAFVGLYIAFWVLLKAFQQMVERDRSVVLDISVSVAGNHALTLSLLLFRSILIFTKRRPQWQLFGRTHT